MWFASKTKQRTNISSGEDLKSRCHTAPTASQDYRQIHAGGSASIQRHSSRPAQARCLCSSSTKKRHFSQPRPISETQVQARPRPIGAWEQAELASPLPRIPPGTGEGKRKSGLALPVAPRLGPGWGGLPPGSPSSPLLPRAPGTVIGPDIRFSHTPSPHYLPRWVSEGPSELSFDAHPHPCWQRQGSKGVRLLQGGPTGSQGSDFKLIAPLASSSSQLMSPSAQTPAQVPPHLVPRPLPLCPCPGRPQGHACFAGLWLLTAHGVTSLCSARGGGLGVSREDILGPFSEGRSLGFSVLHAQGLSSNHPQSRRRPP